MLMNVQAPLVSMEIVPMTSMGFAALVTAVSLVQSAHPVSL